MKRRSFIKQTALYSTILSQVPLVLSCNTSKSTKEKMTPSLKISLAQWSLHRQLQAGQIEAKDFAKISLETYSINAVEYVNQFYVDFSEDEKFWLEMKDRANDIGVKSLLIMVDDEGDLGDSDSQKRKQAVENHYKWVNAAKLLGCHSIRVNAFGDGTEKVLQNALVDGMGQLSEYAAKEEINVLIENHGLYSSDGKFIVEVVQKVNQPNFGTLPDFGNWCLSAKWGSTQVPCDKAYDRYQGVADFLPYAKGFSAKSYDFDENGQDTRIDYYKMLKLAKEAGYDGYVGIEYEGLLMSEQEGILATKQLLEKTWQRLQNEV